MKVAVLVFLLASTLAAAECSPSSLSAKEKLEKFQEMDRAAQSAFDRGDYVSAAGRYRDAACLVPESARAFYGLGIAEAASGRLAEGRKALETAFKILPDNAMPLAMMVRVDAGMKNIERVKEDLRIAAEHFPKDADLHSGLARFLAENQLLDLALAESLRCEQTGSSDASSVIALAVLENSVGAYRDAIRNGQAVEERSGVSDALRASAAGVTGLSYESIGEREQGIKHLSRAIELASSQENSYLALADLYEKERRFQDAVDVLKQCREHVAGSSNWLLPLGNNLVWAEHYDEGIRVLNEVIQKAPNTSEAYIRLAEAYRNTGRPDLEVQALEKLSRIKPDYPMVHVFTARAMMTMEAVDYGAVLRVLSQAEKSAPDDAEIFYLRGKAYAATGNDKDAVVAFERAVKMRPTDPSFYYQLGLTYGKLGQAGLAQRTFDRMRQVKQGVDLR